MSEHDGITFEARIDETKYAEGLSYRGRIYVMPHEKLASKLFGSGIWYCHYEGRQWFKVISIKPEEVSCL
jgi:hypothetical protein